MPSVKWFKIEGSTLLLLIVVHWLAKCLLNMLALASNSVISSLFTSSGGILGIFLPFHKVQCSLVCLYGPRRITAFFQDVKIDYFCILRYKNFTCQILQWIIKIFWSTIFNVFLVNPIFHFDFSFYLFNEPSRVLVIKCYCLIWDEIWKYIY